MMAVATAQVEEACDATQWTESLRELQRLRSAMALVEAFNAAFMISVKGV
jgi:hypothetical protein